MHKRIIFIFFLLFCNRLLSQDHTGIVVDSKTFRPVAQCIVILKGTTISALTDNKGRFTLPSAKDKDRQTVVVAMLGYNTAEFNLSDYKKDTFFLVPKINQLKEVVIVAEKKNVLNPGSEEPVLDFDLLNDHIILLTPGKENNSLKLMDEDGRFIAKMKVDKNSTGLKTDCINNLQLLSRDSAWQIFYDFEKLNSLNPCSFSIYAGILGKCVCSFNEDFYFRDMEYRNLKTHYYFYSEKNKGIRHELVSFEDSAKLSSFELDYNLKYFLDARRQSNYTMYNEPVDSIKKKMQKYREELQLDWSYQKWLGEVRTEMIKSDTGIFIVNFTDSLIYKIDGQNKVSVHSGFPALQADVIPKVLADSDYKENYLIRFSNNQLIFIKFDLQNGKEISRTTVPEVPYLPEKIVIRSGKVYFIQKNLADKQSYKLVKYYLKA